MSSNSTVIHPSSSPTSVPHGPWWGDLTQAKESSYQMSLAVWKKLAQPLRTSTSSFRNIIASLPLCCCCCVTSVVSDSAWPHRQQPTRLPWPWDSRGKNTGVGCHFLLQCMKVESESESDSEVAQSCLTLQDPMDCSLPGSSVHGIFQARVLEWGAIAFSPFLFGSRLISSPHLTWKPVLTSWFVFHLEVRHLSLGSHSILYTLLVCCVCLVSQSCLTLCESMDCIYEAPLSVEILQARLLEWVARASSRGSSQPRDRAQVSCVAEGLFYCLSHQGAWQIHMYSCACSFAFWSVNFSRQMLGLKLF